ncbi:MAG: TetM/TetW/TetO/TetS family tetracycline resistance ribosomal protection protein [Ruminococcaceae bacterium]|nr:TetM/TetW/TetO/TetS family tetracycline resistance ribosomal protection protein [Oscillospiraceae bacterium]
MAQAPDTIRNIGILAHVDAGKTTLTEQMLFAAGRIRQAGSVDSGTTQTDWLSIERDRGISVRSAQTSLPWRDTLINLIDTPGHVDFAGEVERSLLALDGAVLIISAVEGVQSHTENLWNALCRLHIPVMILINKIDRMGSHAMDIAETLAASLPLPDKDDSRIFIPMQSLTGEESRNCRVLRDETAESRITEAAADLDDDIAERFLMEEDIPWSDISDVIAHATAEMRAVPVYFASAQNAVGITELMDGIISWLPSAADTVTDSLSARVFRIEHDKTMGKIAHVRMYGGSLTARDAVSLQDRIPDADAAERAPEKITQIRKFNGQRYVDIGEVHAGDIAALCGLQSAKIWDVIGSAPAMREFSLANPFLQVKVTPQTDAELIPLVNALRELSEEDPLLDYRWEKTEREILVSITGDIQLEVLRALLQERYNLTVTFSPPSIIYKETPSKEGDGYEAYTMPKPCWAIVKLHFEPLPRGSGVIYNGGNIPSNTCFYKYQTHIRQAFFRSLDQGRLGWEVTDFKATLSYAEHHTIHTHPLDFFTATPMAVMNGLHRTGTTLLEPILAVRIKSGTEHLGKIISDITMMRGEFDEPVIRGDAMTLEALLPAATSLDYPVRLAAQSGGRAIFSSRFHGYREVDLALGRTSPRRGIDPLDRAKWILQARGAIQQTD